MGAAGRARSVVILPHRTAGAGPPSAIPDLRPTVAPSAFQTQVTGAVRPSKPASPGQQMAFADVGADWDLRQQREEVPTVAASRNRTATSDSRACSPDSAANRALGPTQFHRRFCHSTCRLAQLARGHPKGVAATMTRKKSDDKFFLVSRSLAHWGAYDYSAPQFIRHWISHGGSQQCELPTF